MDPMEFDFTRLQEAAADLAQKAVQGVNYVARKGKQTYDRLALESELTKTQRQLGAYYYNKVKMGADHDAAMAECIARIDGVLDALNSLDSDVEMTAPVDDDEPVCPVCGAELADDAMFCSQCGTKL